MAPSANAFDKAYYTQFYLDKKTRVTDPETTARLAEFVAHYLRFLRIDVECALDFGCGLGWWKPPLESLFPGLEYSGVEVSTYLCETYGWTHGSIVDYVAPEPADLLICQGVFQYLDDAEAKAAFRSLERNTRQALYLEALTEEDWAENCEQSTTDNSVHLRPYSYYRSALKKAFTPLGGGLFLKKGAEPVMFDLERVAWR